IFDASRRLVGATVPLSRVTVDAGGKLTFDIGSAHLVVKGPQIVIRDSAGNVAGYVYRLPPDGTETLPTLQHTRALDRSFTWIFTGAALFGVVMAIVIARLVTGPVKRLTAAARRMEG